MATILKEANKWEYPEVPLDDVPEKLDLITSGCDQVHVQQLTFLDSLIDKVLDPRQEVQTVSTALQAAEGVFSIDEALANMLVDINTSTHVAASSASVDGSKMSCTATTRLLKGLQPQREVPNKNRGKRFAAGAIPWIKVSAFLAMKWKNFSFGLCFQVRRF